MPYELSTDQTGKSSKVFTSLGQDTKDSETETKRVESNGLDDEHSDQTEMSQKVTASTESELKDTADSNTPDEIPVAQQTAEKDDFIAGTSVIDGSARATLSPS